ncbi:MAG: hypothetical protein WBK76_00815 [Candidatus Saccharimonadales bacterium]
MSTKQYGFTLVEVLVIAPVVILFIGVFIAMLVTMTGESLMVREKNVAVYDSQATQYDIEAEVERSTGFATTTGALPNTPQGTASPQGVRNETTNTPTNTAFTNTRSGNFDTLIMKSPATDKMPGDPTRKLIFQGDGYCLSANRPIYAYWTVYFTAPDRDTTDTSDVALFKRTIMPQTAACARPWQRNSCHPDDKNNPAYNGVCQSRDEKLVSGVTKFWVTYKNEAGGTVTAPSATRISVELSVSKQVAGNAISFTSNSTSNATNIKSIASNPATPALGTINFTRVSPGPNPYRTTFTWNLVGNAMSYEVRYRFLPSGGAWSAWSAWQPVAVDWNPSYSVEGTARKETPAIEVRVITSSGTYPLGSRQATALPSWDECTPLNGWANYDGTYNTLGYTKTVSGAVGLKGLIRSGQLWDFDSATEATRRVCVLPEGFRPANHLIFNGAAYDPNGTNGNGSGRIDIFPDGRIFITGGSNPGSTNGWVSLDGIIYMTASGNPAWQSGSWLNGWYYNSYGDTYPNLGFWKDSLGRVWIQGLATGGPASVTMANIPSNMYPDGGMHYPVSADNRGGAVNIQGSLLQSRPSYGSYISTQLLYYSTGGLYNLALYNGWRNYDTYWSQARCYKASDDIVVLQGLVAAGDAAAGGMAGIHGCAGGAEAGMSTGRRALFSAWKNWESQGRVDLPTDKYLYPMATDPGWTSLDGIHYISN